MAYICRYSIAKVYAAKFKLKTVASVFKIGGNDLSKPIGVRAKSVIGAVETDTHQGSNKKLTGILFDRAHKIHEHKESKIIKKGIQEDNLALQIVNKGVNYSKESWDLKEQIAINPLASRAWKLENTLSNLEDPCAVWGSYEDVQMHNVRAFKDLAKSTNVVHKYMNAIERKQIPVCRVQHLELHGGNWSKKHSKLHSETK